MKNPIIFLAALVLILTHAQADLTFVQTPSINYSAGSGIWTIGFEVSESTDV